MENTFGLGSRDAPRYADTSRIKTSHKKREWEKFARSLSTFNGLIAASYELSGSSQDRLEESHEQEIFSEVHRVVAGRSKKSRREKEIEISFNDENWKHYCSNKGSRRERRVYLKKWADSLKFVYRKADSSLERQAP